MASAELRDELNCSICLNIYTDPVSLRCGHNFCCSCIDQVLDTHDGSEGYFCPDCRTEYLERPALEKNRKLGNIVEHFLSADMEETRIFCTYCTMSPVPAVKSCLHCEISLCDDHLTAHNKTLDHILTKPTDSFGNKKCPIHKKVLELHCLQDEACLCVFCCLVGEHRGHQVELLDEASEKKKKKLREYLDKLNLQKSDIQTRVQNLHKHQRKIQKEASDKRENISKLFMDIKKQLEMAEKKVLSEISRQEEKIVSQISNLFKKLEIEEDELSRKMCHLEKMCHVTDPIRLLQERDLTVCGHGDGEGTEEDGGKIKSEDNSKVCVCDTRTDQNNVLKESGQKAPHSDMSMQTEEVAPVTKLDKMSDDGDETADDGDETADDGDETADDGDETAVDGDETAVDGDETADDGDETADDGDETADDGDETADLDETPDDLDEVLISLTLHQTMRDIVTNVTSQLGFHVLDILLDEYTAHRYVKLSEDLKRATYTEVVQERPKSPRRFVTYPQVLSRCGLSSGRHYWEVEWNQIGICDFGMSYPSIVRKGDMSGIGVNDKSWSLSINDGIYTVLQNSFESILKLEPTVPTFGVFLDYEAGCLSFYELCDPIRHLHTITDSFTEPLYVAFYMDKGASLIIRS